MLPGVMRRVARRSIGLFVVLTVLTVPAVVVANHQFPDVPNAHPFHAEISAIAGAGITAGFGDGNFQPASAVTRQAMAAFMERGFGHARLDIGPMPVSPSISVAPGASTSPPVVVRTFAVDIPGASNAFSPTQLVYLRGRVVLLASMDTGFTGCPCEFLATIQDVTGMITAVGQVETFESISSTPLGRTVDVEAMFAVPPGTRTFNLLISLNKRTNVMNPVVFPLDTRSSFSAATFPFPLENSGS